MSEYWLRPWVDSSAYGCGTVGLKRDVESYQIIPSTGKKTEMIRGMYIQYPESIFAVFVDENEQLGVLLKNTVISLADIKAMQLDIRLSRRQLILHLHDDRLIQYRYLSIFDLLFRPTILLDMIFLDMWELNFELPSWVESSYHRGDEGISFMKEVCLRHQ